MYYSKKQPIGCYITEFLTGVKMFVVQAAGRKKRRQKAAKYHETLKFKRILSNPVKIATKLNWSERH